MAAITYGETTSGEIAVRIIRACRELTLSPIAVYSECDRSALHVRLADEAYFLGPSAPRESYLHIERLLAVAKSAGAASRFSGDRPAATIAAGATAGEAPSRAGVSSTRAP